MLVLGFKTQKIAHARESANLAAAGSPS
jgi:hypothetical protein